MRSGKDPSACGGLQHWSIVDDTKEAATTESSNMHESFGDAFAALSSKLTPVTFKQELPSTGPFRGIKSRTNAEGE